MQISTTNDNSGYAEGWSAVAEQPDQAEAVLRYFAANAPQDAFDMGALEAAQVAFGH
jgi:hypothetical protein